MGVGDWILIAVTVLIAVFGGIFTVLFYLMKRDIKGFEDSIKLLFKKHDEDAAELHELKIKIAELYAPKEEIRQMLTDMQRHLDNRLDGILKVVRGGPGK